MEFHSMPIDNKKKLLIAVIDDNELSRRSIIEILEAENFKIAGGAANVTQALELIANKKPTLLIVDVIMPEVSGIELIKKVMEKYNDIAIIMMSSLSSENIIIESISNGAIDFLKKPFKKETLIDAVNKVKKLLEESN